MDELTPRQAQILQLIREHLSSRGYPPTRAEICRIMGFRSPNAAEEHLKALARKGAIEMAPGASRGLRLKAAAGHTGGRTRRRRQPDPRREPHRRPLPARSGPVPAARRLPAEGARLEHARRRHPRRRSPRRASHARVRVRGRSWWRASTTRSRSSATGARAASSSCCPRIPISRPIVVDLKREALAIEGVAVGVIRNGKLL